METKICNKCKHEKPVSDFYRRSDKPDLYRAVCKACLYQAQKAQPMTDKRRADQARYSREYRARTKRVPR